MSAYRCWCGRSLSSAAQCVVHGSGYESPQAGISATLRTQLAAMTAERDCDEKRANDLMDDLDRVAKERDAALAKVAVLRGALAGVEQFFVRPGEDINEKFERIGHAFYKATRMLRPGKSEPMGCGHTNEEREQAFDTWYTAKVAAARNALEATR